MTEIPNSAYCLMMAFSQLQPNGKILNIDDSSMFKLSGQKPGAVDTHFIDSINYQNKKSAISILILAIGLAGALVQ